MPLQKMQSRLILAIGLSVPWLVNARSHAAEVDLKPAHRPNIVVILADDLGATDLACYGADLHETPVLDALARSSLKCERAYAAAPVCSPTRAALMTGLHPARLGITIWSEGAANPDTGRPLLSGESLDHLPHEYETLAEKLQSAGYRTAIVGKWHLGDSDFAPETQGFEVAVGGTRWGAPPTFFWPYRNDTRFRNEFRYVPGLTFGKAGDYLTDALTDQALRVIDDAGDEPFFLYLSHYAPHTPIEAPQSLVDKYERKLMPDDHHRNATYAAMVENLDINVGRVVEHLKKKGRYDNTLIVFTSDNGGYLGDARSRNGVVTSNAPLRSGKGSVYEGGVRVPLIVKLPTSMARTGTIGGAVVTTDLHFTILGIAGIERAENEQADGIDLGPYLQDPQKEWPDRPLFFHYPHYYETTTPVSAVIEGDHKLLHYVDSGAMELYDLAVDPSESRDISRENPAKAEALKNRLNAWKGQVKAREATINPKYKAKSAHE